MKKSAALMILLSLLIVFSFSTVYAGETYFKFKVSSKAELEKISKFISIDNYKNGEVYAYANDAQFESFGEFGYDIEILPNPSSLIEPRMSSDKADIKAWDVYPTYEAYVAMMYQFAIDYPTICEVVDIGNTNNGRDLLFLKISDNIGVEEDEPEVMYTSSMHGDELTGYVTMLRLIDTLLTTYGTDSMATRLIDSCEIWINPLANPDGSYAGGNSSVSSATRYNANSVDLNRNYKDFEDGDHPDGNSWQIETIAFMDYAEAHSPVIAANFHGGAEVFNFPWDTWIIRHADDQWWQDVGHQFCDTVHSVIASGYMDGWDDGVTNGYDWYSVAGGRQDYMNYYHGCREVTLELSDTKLIPASQLPAHWNYLKVSLIDYLEHALYGIRGIVTDLNTGLPVDAVIELVGHDIDSSQVYTDPDVGDYHRMVEAGTYNVKFSAIGYIPQTISNITVTDLNTVRLDIALEPLADEPAFEFDDYTASAGFPSDTVSMYVTVNNNGGGNAYNTSGVLSTSDGFITITKSTASFPTINALGGSGTSLTDYEFIISPSCTLFHVVDFDLVLTADGGHADTLALSYLVGDRIAVYTDDFSFDQGWTGMGGSGEWTIGPATGGYGSDGSGGADPSSDHTATSDNHVLGNDLTSGSGGDYSSGLTSTYWATSPYIDCSNFSGVEIRFWRWLGVESDSYDHAYFAVYNGTSWVTLYSNDGTINESSWSEQYYDLSAYADSNPDFQIRFGIGVTDGSAQYCGWNIDDIEIMGYGASSTGTPDIAYNPTDIDDSLHLGDTVIDTVKTYNNGDALLRVRYTSTATWLSHNEDQHNIYAGDSLLIPVTISTSGLTPGDHLESIDFTSNDPDSPSGSIAVNLHIYSPDINVTETSIVESVEQDLQTTHQLTVENNGPGNLSFDISRQMFNGKSAEKTIASDPIGYRISDDKISPQNEPYYDKSTRAYGGPDTWGYNWIDSDETGGPIFGWVDISTVGTAITTLGDDDSSAAIPIGFDFPYYENFYNSLNIGSNGIITFGGGSTARTNVTIPTAATPNNLLSVWWDDLDPRQGGNIYYYYDAANSRFIVSFDGIKNYLSSTGTGSLYFQALLYESGKIVFQYGTMDPGTDPAGLAGSTIGIENSNGADGLEVAFNAAYMHDNMAIQFAAASWMSVNPGTGTVAPYSSTIIDVGFDATDLTPDDYTGQLTITSNDPDSPSIDVPVTLTVTEGNAAPQPPTLASPDDAATDQPTAIDIIWKSASTSDSYQLQLDTSQTFATPILDTTLTDTSCAVANLSNELTYYWRVKAHNQFGWSDNSVVWSFETEAATWTCGDANDDGNVNILDVSFMISFLYAFGPAPDPMERADVNGSGTVNILDITYLIAYLYNDGPAPTCP